MLRSPPGPPQNTPVVSTAVHGPEEGGAVQSSLVMRPQLRPYQHEAIQAVIAARKRGVRRMVVSLPTGAGKTVIFSELSRLAKRQVLVLAHREELLEQARDKLQAA